VGITVEGSNTLTRGLIIFGQGLNKSHPYIFPIFQTIQDNNVGEFKRNFNGLLKNILGNYVSLVNPMNYLRNRYLSSSRLETLTTKFSILSNFVAVLGGKIKQKQMISGNMADILSNIYLGYSLIWYHHHYPQQNNILRDECIKYLMQEAEFKMNLLISNYPITVLKPFLYPLKNRIEYVKLEDKNGLYKHILNSEELNEILNQDIYYKGTVLEKMMALSKMERSSVEYKELYQDIIKVGEYSVRGNHRSSESSFAGFKPL
jgi:acyl-CoA dehydrogenase